MVEVELRELVEPVLMLPRTECETHHQRIVIRRDGDAVLREHADVIFEVVPDLEHRFVGEKRVEAPDRVGERHLLGLFGEHVDATMAERDVTRSDEHTSELQSLMRISYAVFCLKKKNSKNYTML